jgi:hypothetical protein
VPETPTGETDAERIARIDAYIERTIAGEQDYYKRLNEGRGRGNVVVGPAPVATPGQASTTPITSIPAIAPGTVPETPTRPANQPVVDTFDFPKVTPADQAVIDLTQTRNGNVVIGPGPGPGPGGPPLGNATGNVVIADSGDNAAGNVVVGPGPGPGNVGNVTIITGGESNNASSNVSGNVVVDEPPVDEDEPPPPPPDEPPPPPPPPPDEPEYKPEIFIYGGKEPPRRPRPELRTTLQGPFAPSTTLGQALTGYRGAGEIEGKKTGKPRKNVWNEESLRLKDALGL